MNKTRVAILASGSGSTAETFIRNGLQHTYPYEVVLLICNNPDAFVLTRIRQLNEELGLHIETVVINSHTQSAATPAKKGHQTVEEQAAILSQLQRFDIDLVLLLGYMKLVGAQLIDAYGWRPEFSSVYEARMLNTHPGLLPDTIGTHGLGTQEFTLAKGLRDAGQTLHIASSTYDTGPTVVEHRLPVEPDDTPESLFARVQTAEKAHIAADIAAFITNQQHYISANKPMKNNSINDNW